MELKQLDDYKWNKIKKLPMLLNDRNSSGAYIVLLLPNFSVDDCIEAMKLALIDDCHGYHRADSESGNKKYWFLRSEDGGYFCEKCMNLLKPCDDPENECECLLYFFKNIEDEIVENAMCKYFKVNKTKFKK